MNDISKSVRVGTVDFFGIMIPGLLIIAMCVIGFFAPLVSIIVDLSGAQMTPVILDTNAALLALALLVVFSYLIGYILRLSSPDTLDRKSAVKVIRGECARHSQKQVPLNVLEQVASLKEAPGAVVKWIRSITQARKTMEEWIQKDGWPFNPADPRDKFPYRNFRTYLLKRGHGELAEAWINWETEGDDSGAAPARKQRSKSTVNKMKMIIRLHCPELSALVESKEAHIRLMAGAWGAFKFSQWPVWIALIALAVVEFAPQWVGALAVNPPANSNHLIYMFINVNLLLVIFLCNQRIERFFHYRRVSELFHIVQAAYLAGEIHRKAAGPKRAPRRGTRQK